nr:MAG TPA: hypothetical protein [Caudoviricetes sp.]
MIYPQQARHAPHFPFNTNSEYFQSNSTIFDITFHFPYPTSLWYIIPYQIFPESLCILTNKKI